MRRDQRNTPRLGRIGPSSTERPIGRDPTCAAITARGAIVGKAQIDNQSAQLIGAAVAGQWGGVKRHG